MAMVAMLHPGDFPEMSGPAALTFTNSRNSGRTSSRSQSRRPQRPIRQVPPAGWTMCECEADKEWVLCNRAEAMAAELAEQFQQHLNQDVEEVSKASAGEAENMKDKAKEETLRRVQQQLLEEEDEMNKAREEMIRAKEEMIKAKEEMNQCEEEMKAKQDTFKDKGNESTESESRKEQQVTSARPAPRRASSRRRRQEAFPEPEEKEHKEPVCPGAPADSEVCSRKQLTKAEKKAAWKASQEMPQMSLVQVHQALEKQRAQSQQPELQQQVNKFENVGSKDLASSPARAKSQRAKSRRGQRAMHDD